MKATGQLTLIQYETNQSEKKAPRRKALPMAREQASLALALDPVPPRSECVSGPRPCPRLDCKQHLWTVERRAGRRWDFREHLPGVVKATPETCALDVVAAAPDGLSRSAVGELLGLSAERVRQIEESAVAKLQLIAEAQL